MSTSVLGSPGSGPASVPVAEAPTDVQSFIDGPRSSAGPAKAPTPGMRQEYQIMKAQMIGWDHESADDRLTSSCTKQQGIEADISGVVGMQIGDYHKRLPHDAMITAGTGMPVETPSPASALASPGPAPAPLEPQGVPPPSLLLPPAIAPQPRRGG